MRHSRKLRSPRLRGRGSAPLRELKVSVIIPVCNERDTLPAILREVRKLEVGWLEVLVISNGSTDGSAELAESLGARVISCSEPLGHDVGRSVGARHASGDILLFLDGDIRIRAEEIKPFIRAVSRGVDVALNRYIGPAHTDRVHPVVLSKHALNTALGRPELRGVSLTTVPHALSRRAVELIGAEQLAVPPKAYAMAVMQGLRVEPVHLVEVGRLNRRRGRRQAATGQDVIGRLIVGDHLEAIRWLLEAAGERGRFTDLRRNRNALR